MADPHMTPDDKEKQPDDVPGEAKRPYHRPRLQQYGTLRALTRGVGGMHVEQGNPNAKTKIT